MAEIREVLSLVDGFSANMSAYLRAAQNASACNRQLQNNVRRVSAQMAGQSAAMRAAAGAAGVQGAAARIAVRGNVANANALRMAASAANAQSAAVQSAAPQNIVNANAMRASANAANEQGAAVRAVASQNTANASSLRASASTVNEQGSSARLAVSQNQALANAMRSVAGAANVQNMAIHSAVLQNRANANAMRASANAANEQGAAVRAAASQNTNNASTILRRTNLQNQQINSLVRLTNAETRLANTQARQASAQARLLITQTNLANVQARQTNTVTRQGNAFNAASNLVRRQTAAVRDNTAAVNAATAAWEQYNSIQTRVQIAADVARAEQRRQQQQMEASRNSANSLTRSLRRLGGTYFGLRGITGIASLSDELVSAEARLNLINDGLQTTAELQGMIYRAAERSRGSYTAMSATVSKLGILARGAFDSTQEMVAFTELLNKNFVIGGASAQEQTAAMYQLTQAMASGRLQGDEYRSIIENAPLLAQAIEDYMRNVQNAKGTMKDWASAGLLTSDVIKAAMFSAADEVEARFAAMPVTWAQAWQQAKNLSIEIFQPVLNGVGKAAGFVSRHIEVIAGGFYGLTVAVGGYTIAQLAASNAFRAFVLGMLESPLLPVAAAFIAIGAAVGLFIKHCGSAKAAWLTFVDASLTAGQNLWIGLVSIFYNVQNKFDETILHFAIMTTNISNGFGDLKVSVLKHLQDLVNGGIGYVNRFISVLNKIPGVNIAPVEAAAFGDNAAEKNNARKAKRAANLADRTAQVANNTAERAGNISALKLARDTAHAARLEGIEEAKAEAAGFGDYSRFGGALDGMANNLSSIAGDTKAIKNSVDLSAETMKMLVDMAERRYVNNINLTTQAPVIQISGQNTGDTKEDRRRLVNMLRDQLLEEMSAGAARSTAAVF